MQETEIVNYEEVINRLEDEIVVSQRIRDKLAEYPGTEDDCQRIDEDIELKIAIIEFATLSAMYQRDLREVVVPDLKAHDHRESRRRQCFTTVFSWIEALNYQLRQIALAAQGGYINAHFEPAEIMLLREERYSLDEERGRAVVRPNQFLKLLPNTRFTFRMFARAYGSSWQLPVGTNHWQDFHAAYEIRNSLAHPKSSQSLVVTDAQVETLARVAKWYGEQLGSMVTEAAQIVKAKADESAKRSEEHSKRMHEDIAVIYGGLEALNRAVAIIDSHQNKADLAEEDLDQWRTTRSNLEETKAWLLTQLPKRLKPPSLD